MPVDMKRYPANWREISNRIRFERAKGKCERCGAEHGKPHPRTGSKVVLTTAHIGPTKHDKMDCRDEALLALCQACHLREDIHEHMRHAAETRRQKKIQAGQLEIDL
jgi:hypothetical protein